MNRSAQPADQAEVNKAAFTTDGSVPMPALLMAMTKGDLAAVDFRLRDGSDGETSSPI